MKKLEAIIKPFKLEEVKEALADLGVEGMTLCEVKGFGHRTAHTEIYRDNTYRVDFLPRFKVEVVLPDELIDPAVRVVLRAARTGQDRRRQGVHHAGGTGHPHPHRGNGRQRDLIPIYKGMTLLRAGARPDGVFT